jgi:hypothetical protein
MVVKSWILLSPILTKDVAATPIHPPKKLTSSQVLFKSGPGFHKFSMPHTFSDLLKLQENTKEFDKFPPS